MREFIVGLLVVVAMLLLAGVGVLLIPVFLLLGLMLRLAVGVLVPLIAVWLIGKLTFRLIEAFRKKENG